MNQTGMSQPVWKRGGEVNHYYGWSPVRPKLTCAHDMPINFMLRLWVN